MFRTGIRSADLSAARYVGRLGALGLVAVLVLGGCSGSGGDPDAEAAEGRSSSAAPGGSAGATESASASPTATPTPTPAAAYKPASAEGPAENVPLPVMPELAKQESKEGLEAFAEYWYALANYGYETGDPEPLRAISGPDCAVCDVFYTTLESGFEDQDWMAGSNVTVRDVHSDFILTPDGYYQVLVQITQKDLEYFGPDGVDYGIIEGINAPIVQIIEASYDGSSWRAMLVESI